MIRFIGGVSLVVLVILALALLAHPGGDQGVIETEEAPYPTAIQEVTSEFCQTYVPNLSDVDKCDDEGKPLDEHMAWGLKQIGLKDAWHLRGSQLSVGLVDRKIYENTDLSSDLDYECISEAGCDNPHYGDHGTKMAGIIAAKACNDVGVMGVVDGAFVGVGYDGINPDELAKAIDKAVEKGADILSISQVLDRGSSDLRSAVESAVREGRLLVVTGPRRRLFNCSEQCSYFPACYRCEFETGVVVAKGYPPHRRSSVYPRDYRDIDTWAPGQCIPSITGTSPEVMFSDLGGVGGSEATAIVAAGASIIWNCLGSRQKTVDAIRSMRDKIFSLRPLLGSC